MSHITDGQLTDGQLMRIAMDMTSKSYAPFSKFHVGAALLGKNGVVYTGCNVENSSFGGTICAERTAFVKAVSEGCRSFEKIAIVAAPGDAECADGADCAGSENSTGGTRTEAKTFVEAWPCGICRQFMQEFCDADFVIITGSGEDAMRTMTMAEILPEGFRL